MREDYFKENKFWVSPYNFIPEVREGLILPPKVQIHERKINFG